MSLLTEPGCSHLSVWLLRAEISVILQILSLPMLLTTFASVGLFYQILVTLFSTCFLHKLHKVKTFAACLVLKANRKTPKFPFPPSKPKSVLSYVLCTACPLVLAFSTSCLCSALVSLKALVLSVFPKPSSL